MTTPWAKKFNTTNIYNLKVFMHQIEKLFKYKLQNFYEMPHILYAGFIHFIILHYAYVYLSVNNVQIIL